jgi:hypothetical protein
MGETGMQFGPFMSDREQALRWREQFDVEIASLLEAGWKPLSLSWPHDVIDDYGDEGC